MANEYDVTSVGVNPSADRSHRMRMYFIAMSIRVLCVASLFFVRGLWLILVGALAVVLPYFAVLVANAHDHRGGEQPEAPAPLALEDPHPAARPESASQTTIIVDAPAERRARGDAQ